MNSDGVFDYEALRKRRQELFPPPLIDMIFDEIVERTRLSIRRDSSTAHCELCPEPHGECQHLCIDVRKELEEQDQIKVTVP